MTERTLTATVDAADGVPATGTVEIIPTGTRSSDPTLVSAEPIIYKIIAGALVRDTGAVGEAAPTIWSPGNYIIVIYDENRAKLERYEVAVEESALSVSLNELYRQANGATPVVDDQPLYTGDDAGRLVLAGGTEGQVAGIGPDGHLTPSDAGSGDMTKSVYDPTNIAASAFARANHTGTQPLSTISDAGNAASKNVGAAAGTVASGDHTHSAASGAAAGFMAATDKTKLDGIATGATANATDAELRDRATHTGAQAIGTVTGLQTALDAKASTAHASTHGSGGTDAVTPGSIGAAAASHTHAAGDITGLATVATTGSYTDLTNRPAAGASLYLLLSHRTDPSVDGGTFNAGGENARPITTIEYNGSGYADNVIFDAGPPHSITIPDTGTYLVKCWGKAKGVSFHQVIWRCTNGQMTVRGALTDSIYGSSEYAVDTYSPALRSNSLFSGVFAIAASRAFQLVHWSRATTTADGYGGAIRNDVDTQYPNLFAEVEIWKLA